eukprot:gnl/Dysnectes_brevis/5540_a8006_493.p1 GENE.gnl/Dysnectes_brevis/5540_a8006_493~~gnl/Dysnectes_brevis/5540_a8006_493.p1  ORF type:complete len:387 (-),score=17.21 gnl/Dysnectes_brevis/5540_a8006_493:19-1179(-)
MLKGFIDDKCSSVSIDLQKELEESCKDLQDIFNSYSQEITLQREATELFLLSRLSRCPFPYDFVRPVYLHWLLTAFIHSSPTHTIPEHMIPSILKRVTEWTNNPAHGGASPHKGSFGHTMSTFGSVLAVALIGTSEAYQTIDVDRILTFLRTVKHPSGGFRADPAGECDVRVTYCAIVVASLTGILVSHPELFEDTAAFIVSCQNPDGGIRANLGESHAGYVFCGLAALSILGQAHLLNMERLAKWVTWRQSDVLGGCNGRPGKLVDGCYSWWIGASSVIIKRHLPGITTISPHDLQRYILSCCQSTMGGMRDKPEADPDVYHSCYVLSGLCMAQGLDCMDDEELPTADVIGSAANMLSFFNPLYNLPTGCAKAMREWYTTHTDKL